MDKLLELMAALRDPDTGCPWDREQSFHTIAPYTVEEAYEVADAIAREAHEDLRDELGDLLLQVVYHAQMASEQSLFDFEDVVAAICDKLERRHPHVFGDEEARKGALAQQMAWERDKGKERAADTWLGDVPLALPALMRAQKLQKRAAAVGFDWPDARGARDKISEELAELDRELTAGSERESRQFEELGDLLFAVTNLARKLGFDAEDALRHGCDKFTRRFEAVEAAVSAAGDTLEGASLEALDAHWEKAKSQTGKAP